MSNSLPPLPELSYLGEGGESNYGYDAEDMHAYARAATEASRAAVPAGWVLSGKYGDVLTPFVALMEAELHANSQKGDRPGWLTMSPETGLLEIYWHTAKLSAAVKNNDGPAIIEHSADVANMAMMLLDVCGGLAAAPQPVAQPGERWHVGDSAFESWFANYCPAGKGDKQRARDAYAAGMGDRAPVTQAKPEQAEQQWQPIETAPKDGRTLLIGYFNSRNNWRTMRGQWMSGEQIADQWEEPENGEPGWEPGWFETAVEPDDVPNCWPTDPTHWMPIPASPKPKDWPC